MKFKSEEQKSMTEENQVNQLFRKKQQNLPISNLHAIYLKS